MATQTDFMMIINQISAERNIDVNEVLEAIKEAIMTGYKRYNNEEEDSGSMLNVEIDPMTGAITVYVDKKVVDVVTNSATQISLKEAKKLEPKLKVGDHVEVDVTPEGDFGRVAAQAAKQVILQKIRESEKEAVLKEFTDRIGEIETAVVQRMDGENVLWEVRKATGVMPKEDRVPTEFYKSGNRHKILIKEIKQTPRGKQLIVSRADDGFLRALFELEVPEIVSETVEIKAIAREAGSRSKVAVHSNAEGIDPIGSCVGQKGVRINAIMNELTFGRNEARGEKIDIILWDEEMEQFIANALAPAEVKHVEIVDAKEKVARVIVPDDHLSLAIGKEGQNVRLAAKLTGWKIDIQGETIKIDPKDGDSEKSETKSESKTDEKSSEGGLESLKLGSKVEKSLADAGITTVEALKTAIEKGDKIKGVGPKSVDTIKEKLG